jgi:hypothetical protein
MKKRPRPFFRKPRGLWYIQIGSKQFNLGPDQAVARRQADDRRVQKLFGGVCSEKTRCSRRFCDRRLVQKIGKRQSEDGEA